MAWDDPRVLALISAAGGFLDPNGGPSAAMRLGMQGLLAGNQMQNQRTQAELSKRKLTRQMDVESALKEYSEKFGGDQVGLSRALVGSGHPDLIKLGIDISKAKSVKSYMKGLDDKGNPTYYAGYNTGEVSPTGVTPAERLMQINRGSQIDLANPYTGEASKSLAVGMSPGESARLNQASQHFGASHALDIARTQNSINQTRLPQFKDGYWVTPPTQDNPQGSMIPTDLATTPKGSEAEKAKMSVKVKDILGDDTETLIKQATGSLIGSAVDSGVSAFGGTTSGAKANATLKLRANTLAGNMPRFEGPQSDADRKYYLEMAGNLGDSSRTTEEKLAALRELKRIHRLADGSGRINTSVTQQKGGASGSFADGWGDIK